jgi:peptidoglycan/LPS O-acetylase OafA/YrhL
VRAVRDATIALFLTGVRRDDRLAVLDTVRALAVLLVVLHHTWAVAGSPGLEVDLGVTSLSLSDALSGAGLGVDIFFVLSGFLLSLPWHKAARDGRARPSLPRYYLRRFLRIAPPYWFMLMVMCLLMAGTTIPWPAIGGSDGVRALVAHFFFVQYLFPSTAGDFAGVNGSLWTLTIEMIFYITLPLLVLAFIGRRWRIGLPLSVVFSLVWVWLSWHHFGAWVGHLVHEVERFGVPESQIRYFLSTQFPAFVGEFGIGIVVAGWWTRRYRASAVSHPGRQRLAAAGAALGASALVVVMYLDGADGGSDVLQVVARMVVAAAVGLLVLCLLAGPVWLRRPFSFLPFRLYGVIGYSVFLWHLPLLTAIGTWPIFDATDRSAAFWELLAIGLPVTTVWGVVMFLLVERPFLVSRPARQASTDRRQPKSGRPTAASIDPEAW